MHLPRDGSHLDSPDIFLERTLQVRLVRLWYSINPSSNGRPLSYDPGTVEEIFGRLQREFVSVLPPVFDFHNPDLQWDRQMPMLKCQRQMLRISVFALLLQLFRPLLLFDTEQMESVHHYKRRLAVTQRSHLVESAMSLLDSIACLHDLMGGSQTKFYLLSFYTFEPAMLLGMHLLSFEDFQGLAAKTRTSYEDTSLWKPARSAQAVNIEIELPSKVECRAHIDRALERLDMLREVSIIAEVGAQKLRELVSRLDMVTPVRCPQLRKCKFLALTKSRSLRLIAKINQQSLVKTGIPTLGPLCPRLQMRGSATLRRQHVLQSV